MKIDLDCKDVSRLLSEGSDTTMPLNERARLRLHLVLCQACREVDQQFSFLRKAMRSTPPDGSDEG